MKFFLCMPRKAKAWSLILNHSMRCSLVVKSTLQVLYPLRFAAQCWCGRFGEEENLLPPLTGMLCWTARPVACCRNTQCSGSCWVQGTETTGVLISLQPDQEGHKLQRQKILSFIYPIYNRNWRNISTIYIYNKTSIKRNIPTIKENTSGSRSG